MSIKVRQRIIRLFFVLHLIHALSARREISANGKTDSTEDSESNRPDFIPFIEAASTSTQTTAADPEEVQDPPASASFGWDPVTNSVTGSTIPTTAPPPTPKPTTAKPKTTAAPASNQTDYSWSLKWTPNGDGTAQVSTLTIAIMSVGVAGVSALSVFLATQYLGCCKPPPSDYTFMHA
jgi:hypothetical protein